MEKWIEHKLNNFADKISDGIHSTPKYNVDGKYYFINGNNLEKDKIKITRATKRIDEDEFEKHKRPLNERSILMSINGTIGNLAYFNSENVVLG